MPEVVAEEGATRYRAFFKVLGSQPAVGCWLSAAWQRGPIISAKGVQPPAKMDHLTPPPQATEIPTPPMSRMSSIVLLHSSFTSTCFLIYTLPFCQISSSFLSTYSLILTRHPAFHLLMLPSVSKFQNMSRQSA